MAKMTKKTEVLDLPPGIKASDCKPEQWKRSLTWEERKQHGCEEDTGLRFYKTTGFGWVLLTLHISKPGRRSVSQTDRSYGITLDGKVVRVGKGPHVLKELLVYINKDNVVRLTKYIDLRNKGLGDAGQIRDRISSRRAQGQLHRQQGHTSWIW